MKKSKILAIIFALVLVITSNSFAQFKNWAKSFNVDLAMAMLKSEETGNSLDGYFVSGAFEQISYDGLMAGGVRFGYLSTKEEGQEADRSINYFSMPITLYGKYYFGPEKIKGYVLGEVGLQFSRYEFFGTDVWISDNDAGIVAGLGLGGQLYLNEKTFFNLGYSFNFWGNSYYQDGFLHQIKLGIGFQYE